MILNERLIAKERTAILLEGQSESNQEFLGQRRRFSFKGKRKISPADGPVNSLLLFAGVPCSAVVFILVSVIAALFFAYLSSLLLSAWFSPLVFLLGLSLPFSWADARAQKRASKFSSDYASCLLATASSMKTGMTPILALERSTRLLHRDSQLKKEINKLLEKFRRGEDRVEALKEFGRSYRLEELELFRRAFYLTLEHGGKFSPTLERLARVSRDRSMLMTSASVSTANMRMTANILLVVTPIALFIVSSGDEDYWDLFINHPTAHWLASLGILLIGAGYFLLRSMSNFRP